MNARPDFFATAAEIVSPPVQSLSWFIAKEREADEARERAWRIEADRSSGAHFGGMECDPFTRRSEAQLRRDAITRRQAMIDYRAGRTVSMFRSFL